MRRLANIALTSVILLLLASLFVARDADAFVTLKYGNVEPVWDDDSVTWYLSTGGSDDVSDAELVAALEAAFQSWDDVSCSTLTYTYGGRRSSAPGGVVFVRFQESHWDPTVGDAAAYAMSQKDWSGHITSSEIVFNGQDVSWTTTASVADGGYRSDIQGVAAHEIGHTLGLDHTRVREATMFFSGGGSGMRSLDPDDQRGACYLYPTAGGFTSGQVCDSCTSDSHCHDGACVQYYQAPDSFCGYRCDGSADCPDGYVCYTDYYPDSGLDECVPINGYCNDAGHNAEMGDYCYGYDVCTEGLICLAFGDEAYCSETCTSTCPEGYQCLSGYCIRGGSGGFGDSCEGDFDCASFRCATARPGVYVCSQECEDDGDCPPGGGCTRGQCFVRGGGAFGTACETHMDCSSAYCVREGDERFCSEECTVGDSSPCPERSTCIASGYCSQQALRTGDPCQSGTECPSGDFCKFPNSSASWGVCASECDPMSGHGCERGESCSWVEMPWLDRVTGECRPMNEGGHEGDACALGTAPCEFDQVCVAHDAGDFLCYGHCRVDTGQGCSAGETCLSLGETSSPLHGYCYREPAPPAPDTGAGGVDVPSAPTRDVDEPPPVDAGASSPSSDTGWTPPLIDTGSGTSAVDAGALAPSADAVTASGDVGMSAAGAGGGGGGCAAGGQPATSAPLLLMFLLSLLLAKSALSLRRARRPRRR